MIIKFYCEKHCADFQKTEEELRNQKVITNCPFCGQKLRIQNLNEIITLDTEQTVKEYVDLWFLKMGIEYTIELIERHKDLAVYRLYKAEIEKRGFKLRGEKYV